jgi:hypothetical protein
MHTSWTLFTLFWIGVGLGVASQVCNYRSTFGNRMTLRKVGFWLGISGTVIAGGTAFTAAIKWNTLPLSGEGLKAGELYDNGGIAAIVESPERLARIKQIDEQIIKQINEQHSLD